MPLPFSANRRLSRIAADAARIEADATAQGSQPWRRTVDELSVSRATPCREVVEADEDVQTRRELEAAIEVAVVGTGEDLARVLTEDAVSLSPTQAFRCRAQAVAARCDPTTALIVVDFEVTRLLWTACLAVAEWRLVSTQAAPLLVGDDLLVEGSTRPITLAGVTIAEREGCRFSEVRTYFDEADLIEQVVLDPQSCAPRLS